MEAPRDLETRPAWNVRALLGLAVFGCLVWLTYQVGIAFYFEPEDVATFWLTNGLVIGALIVSPRRVWLPVLVVQYAVQFLLNLDFSLEFAAIVTTVNTVSAFGAVLLIHRLAPDGFDTRRISDILIFIAAVLAAESLNGLGGALAVTRRVDAAFWDVWQIWTLSTMTGSLVVGSATIALARLVGSQGPSLRKSRWVEAGVVMVAGVAVSHVVFSRAPGVGTILGAPVFTLLFLIWSALRLGPDFTLALLFIVSVQIVHLADQGYGPFDNSTHTAYERALMVQGCIFMNLLVTFIVSALNAERDATLKELEESKERFRSLVETTSDWVWEMDDKANFRYVSPRVKDILGYEPCELIGKSGHDLMPPDEAGRISPLFSEFVGQHKSFHNLQNINLHKNGNRVILESSAEPFFDAKGKLLGYRGIDRDITLRVRSEKEKLQMQSKLTAIKRIESLGALAGGVAHDLNNILGPLVALPALVREDLAQIDIPQEQWEETRANLDMMEQSGHKAARIVSDLLALGRRSRHEFSPFDLTILPAMFLQGRELQELKKKYPGVTVSYASEEEELVINADSDSLARVIANLAANAVEAVGEKGEVTIRAYREQLSETTVRRESMPPGTYAVLSVSDNGCGIAASEIEHIFEPFFSRKGKSRHSGSGLGLSVVHGIVKDHDGYVDAESVVGKGSTFSVYFPELSGAAPADSGDEGAPRRERGQGRVLVVDDLDTQRAICRRCLEPLGYIVSEASNGREAVSLFEKAKAAGLPKPFDIVILDMVMEPDLDGCSACQSILGMYPGTPIVIVSGHAENERFETARKLGASTLQKPYTRHELVNAVAERLV